MYAKILLVLSITFVLLTKPKKWLEIHTQPSQEQGGILVFFSSLQQGKNRFSDERGVYKKSA
jgi:hypothetical protein